MLKFKNVRIMLVLLVIGLLYTFVLGCVDTADNSAFVTGAVEEVEGWSNDLADAIDTGAEELGIPNQTSGEIFDIVFPNGVNGDSSVSADEADLSDLHGIGW